MNKEKKMKRKISCLVNDVINDMEGVHISKKKYISFNPHKEINNLQKDIYTKVEVKILLELQKDIINKYKSIVKNLILNKKKENVCSYIS